jgi:hypothetical protein
VYKFAYWLKNLRYPWIPWIPHGGRPCPPTYGCPQPMGPPTHGGPQPMGTPNPWGPPTHGGPQPMGAVNPWGPYPWGFPSFVGTSPLGPLSPRTLGTPNFRALSLGGPRALGAPRPGLVGLVGNPPLTQGIDEQEGRHRNHLQRNGTGRA